MIYDCFLFFNELRILELRLEELNSIVDQFVLVESTRTFSNNPKPLYFQQNKELFDKYAHKIRHIVVDEVPQHYESAWDVEHFQRDAIIRGLEDASLDDLVIISDVDEIPRSAVIRSFTGDVAALEFDFFYYKLNYKNLTMKWVAPIVIRRSHLSSPEAARVRARHCRENGTPIVPNAGWHFSYMQGPADIKLKLESFSHQEFNTPEFTDACAISDRIKYGLDLFGRADHSWCCVPLDATFPAYVLEHPEKFRGFTADFDEFHVNRQLLISSLRQGEGELARKNEELSALQRTLARKDDELAGIQEMLVRKDKEFASLSRERSELWNKLKSQEEALSRAAQIIDQIYASHGWKALSFYYRLRDKLTPERSWRRGVLAKLLWIPRVGWDGVRLLRDMQIIAGSGLFDKGWYLQQNPDVAKAGVNPLRHYLRRGAGEGRDPNPYFDSDWYLQQNPDVAKAAINPLRHYIRRGALEGRDPSFEFDTKWYLREHPDAARDRANPLAHYLRSCLLPGGGERPQIERRHINSQDLPPTVSDPILQGSDLNCEEETDWQEYRALAHQISVLRQRELEKLSLEAPGTITIEDGELFDAAKSLIFRLEEEVEVSIIIPVFNNLKFTLECLTSVMTYSGGTPYEVIVVDDSSTDRTAEILSRIGNMVYIKNERNIGFLHSCNRGAERARGEYIVFLNNDAQVTEGWLQPLLTTLRENSGVGAVGPKILYPNGRLQEAGVLVNRDGTSKLVGLFDDPGLPRYNYQREVMYCSGACLLVRASTFKDLGGFDADFAPGYCEDCDLSFRLRERGLRLFYNPKSVVIHHLSVTSNSVDQDFKMQAVIRNRQKLSEKWQRQIDDLNKIRIIAFYLPQYHPIPENDRWWGKGFTEWTNVAKARPNFSGHYQPHVPADLGFYDLRLGHVMEEQTDLAKRYSIHGFCYYYYWFAGKRLLEMPLDRILETGKPDFPFCIAWANENWTRRWDGHENEVLLAQQHSDDDDRAVLYDMMPYMTHSNYIRINGRPLLIIYRVNLFPDIKRTVHVWRDLCRREGIGEIYLAFVESFEYAAGSQDPAGVGFDASIEFPPHGMPARIPPPGPLLNPQYRGVVHDYRQVVLSYLRLPVPGHARFRTAMPSWDNTPRRQNDSVVFANASPGAYQAWLEAIIQQTHEQKFGDERIVFVNAWNEWAEGNHLEPDQRNGHAFLQATRNAQEAWLMDKFADRVD